METELLSNKIKELRKSRGLSQELLAENSNLSLRTIQRIENGETEPRGDTLRRLAHAFGLSAEDFASDAKKRDQVFISLLNISPLSLFIFPPLVIISPLALWVWKRQTIKNVDKIGKEIVNFQITMVMALPVIFFGLVINYFSYMIIGQILFEHADSKSIPFFIFTILIYVVYNFYAILKNTLRIQKGESVSYWPQLRFLK